MAKRKGLDPVKASLSALPAGGFRIKRASSLGRAEKSQFQEVKASIKRQERFRSQPVKHSQSSTRD